MERAKIEKWLYSVGYGSGDGSGYGSGYGLIIKTLNNEYVYTIEK